MSIKKFITLLFITFALGLITGCGFSLRGEQRLPPQLTLLYLQTNNEYGALSKELHQALQNQGVNLVNSSKKAPITLKIVSDVFTQQLSSVSASSQIVQYLIAYKVTYAIYDAQGNTVINPTIITVTRNYTANLNQMLGGSIEQNLLQDDMRRDAIQQLLYQLGSANALRALQQNL